MLALLVLATVALASAHHSGEHFEGEKVFRVTVEDENHISLLQDLASTNQIDFWKPDSATQIKPHSKVDFRVQANDISTVEDFLEQNELQYEVLISNLRLMLEAQFDSQVRASGHSYLKYNNWETIEAWTQQVASENPGFISRSSIGTTFEGRTIYLLKVGKPGRNKPAIFMDCGFHAREWISPAFCQWFVREAIRTYGKESHMTEFLEKLDFYVLPVFNIDGYIYTWTKNRMWRKTRSKHAGTQCIGTDPNRNFDAGWCKIGASKNPCDETYCGSAAESEKETKALANFIRSNLSSIKAYLTIHSYSQLLLYPYSYDYKLTANNAELRHTRERSYHSNMLANARITSLSPIPGRAQSPSLVETFPPSMLPPMAFHSAAEFCVNDMWTDNVGKNALAKATVKELATLYGTKYTYGPGASTIYPAAGGSDDWAYDQGIKYSFTFELRDKGRYGFTLPESQIQPTCEEMMLALKHIASYVLDHLY